MPVQFDARQLAALFDAHVPQTFQEQTLRLLVALYRETQEQCHNVASAPQARDLLPYFRRARIESDWALLAQRHPGLSVAVRRNAARNCHHVEISAGRVVLTESKTEGPSSMPAEAEFRDTIVQACQPSLFELEPMGTKLYAILIHGTEDGQNLSFARVAFPTRDLLAFRGAVDLFERFPRVVSSQGPAVEEVAEDSLALRLKETTKADAQ